MAGNDPKWLNPAGPEGLNQQAAASGGPAANGQDSSVPKWLQPSQPAWQTGGQAGSTENGWNTPFYEKMFKQRDEELDKGTLNSWYGRQDFTGVATWDGTKDASGRAVKFGDVYEDGQWRGNLLDPSSGYDEQAGYTMLAQLTLDSTEQAKAFEKLAVNPNAVKEAVTSRKDETDKSIAGWVTQQDYQNEVEGLKQDWDDGSSGAAAAAAGAGGGAAVGAGVGALVGSVVPVLGTAVGAGVGAVVGAIGGGIAAFSNRDTLVDQAARASVQTGMAAEEFGAAGALATGLRNWGGVAVQAISPLSNATQALGDTLEGNTQGDDVSGYYAMEERPLWLTGLNTAASFGDALLQFAGPVSSTIYLGATGATVLGGVGQLAFQGGATFDDRTGDFDSPDDLGQWAAAVGGVGIDAVGLLGAGGILKGAANAARGLDGAAAGVVRTETLAGRKFTLDEAGNVTGVKTSLTVMAPSEATQFASVRVQALQAAAKERGAVSADQFNNLLYRAAIDLQNGSNLAKTALVNAFGEGLEEGTQAVLEPLSHGWTPELGDVYEAFLQGAAAGAGMSAGARLQYRPESDQNLQRANISRELNGQPQYSAAEWAGLNSVQKVQAAALPAVVEKGLARSAEAVKQEMIGDRVRFTAGAERIDDAARVTMAAEMKNLDPALEGTYSLTQVDSARVPNHVVQVSVNTALELLQNNYIGLQEQLAATTDPAEQQKIQAVATASELLAQRVQQLWDTTEDKQQATNDINEVLRQAWDSALQVQDEAGAYSAASRAVTVLLSRDPNNSAGSFQALLPQVSLATSTKSGGDGVLQVSQAILKAIDGDFDGDKMRQRVRIQFATDDAVFRSVRLGQNYQGTKDGSPNIPVRTYEEEQTRQLGVALLSNNARAGNAELTLEAIRNWLTAALPTVPDIASYADRFVLEVRSGNAEAKSELLRWLATEQADAMFEVGEQGSPLLAPLSNVWLAIDGKINEQLQWFAEVSAAREDAVVNLDDVDFVAPGSSLATVAVRQAATLGISMQQETSGQDAFRSFQKLHYSGYRSPAVASELTTADQKAELQSLTAFYEQLSGGMKQSAIQEIFAKDEVTKTAMRQMVALAQSLLPGEPVMQSVAALSGMEVPNIYRDERGFYSDGSTVSVAQWALRNAAKQFEVRDSVLLESNPDLASKYALYQSMGPGDAIAELLDDAPMVALLGEAANNFGANLTFGQVKASYINRSTESRRSFAQRARLDVRYNKAASKDLPYSQQNIESGAVSAYQILVDALFEAGNGTVGIDPATGKLLKDTRLARAEKRTQDSLESGLRKSQSALKDLAKLYKLKLKRGAVVDAQAVARVLDNNPDVARSVLNLLPDDVVHAVIGTNADGTVVLPRWFSEMLVSTEPKQAAMVLFRQTLLAQIRVRNAEATPRPAEDRLVALVERLRSEGEPRLLEFQQLLYSATDVPRFMELVNKKFLRNEAPFLAWHRDAAQFDSTRTQGGWSRALPGVEQRDAIAKFETAAARFSQFASQEELQDKTDRSMIASLHEAQRQREAGRQSDTSRLLQTLDKRIKDAGQLLAGMGPAGMKLGPLAAALGFFGGATDKGAAAELFQQIGNDSARDVRVWATGTEQLEDALTTSDAQDLAQNPNVLARGELRIADNEGRRIQWSGLDSALFLNLWQFGTTDPAPGAREDASLRPMLRAIVFPSAWEVTQGGNVEQQQLTGTSLTDLLSEKTYLSALRERSHTKRMQYASIVDALSAKHGGSYEIQRLAADLVVARTSGATKQLEVDELSAMMDEAYNDVVELVRVAADLGSAAVLEQVKTALQKLQLTNKLGNIDPSLAGDLKNALLAEAETALGDEAFESLRVFLDGTAFTEAVERFTINWDGKDQTSKQEFLFDYVMDHPEVRGENVARIRSSSQPTTRGTIPVLSASETESRSFWDGASREVIAAFVRSTTSVSLSRDPALAIPNGDTAARIKYWDQSYKYLVDDVLDSASPLMAAAAEFRTIVLGAGNVTPSSTVQDLQEALQRVLNPDHLGPWTEDIARASVDAQNRIDSSGAGQQVARAGIAYAKQAAISAATRRTYRNPVQDSLAPRLVSLQGQNAIDFLQNDSSPLDASRGLLQPDGTTEATITLNGRFLVSAKATYRGADGNPIEVDLFTSRVKVGHLVTTSDAARTSGFLATTADKLRSAIQLNAPQGAQILKVDLEMWHPQDKPATPEYANNLFFEGSVFGDKGDVFSSLNEALWFSSNGLNVTEQLAALKANKKGKRALRNPTLPSRSTVLGLENISDLYGTIRAKALFLMGADGGHGQLDPAFYPAVLKNLTLRHGVRGLVDGQVHLFSAEQVIAHQRTAPGTLPDVGGSPLEQPEIVALSARELRTLLGEQGVFGLLRPLDEVPTIDSTGVRTWTGSLEALADRLPGLTETDPETGGYAAGDIGLTKIAQRRQASQLTVRPSLSRQNRQAYLRRLEIWSAARDSAEASRSENPARYDIGRKSAMDLIQSDAAVFARQPHLTMLELGFPIDLPGGVDRFTEGKLASLAFQSLTETLKWNEHAAGWIYTDDPSQPGSKGKGVLKGFSSLEAGPKTAYGENVVYGDLVAVRLETFTQRGRDEADRVRAVTQAMHRFAGLGVTVALTDQRGDRDLRIQAGNVLETLGYERVAGAPGLYRPADPEQQFATLEARYSRLAEVEDVNAQSTIVVFQADNVAVEENAWIVNDVDAAYGREVIATRDLTPVTSWPGYNVPRTGEQREAVGRFLRALAEQPELQEHAARLGDTTVEELQPFIENALSNYDEATGLPAVNSVFGPGDLIALIGQQGQIILYRHGYDAFDESTLDSQLLSPVGGKAGNLAVYTAKQMQTATTHRGPIQDWETISNYGLQLIQRIPVGAIANKTVINENGMKFVGIPIDGTGLQLPEFGPLASFPINGIASRADSLSKENFAGVIDTSRNAFAYLGVDFVPAMAQSFFGIDADTWRGLDASAKNDYRQQVRTVLEAIRRGTDTYSVLTVQNLQEAITDAPARLTATLASLTGTPEFQSAGAQTGWTGGTTPQDQVTMAAVIYMMAPQADPSHVMGASGFGGVGNTDIATSVKLPELFTGVFDRAPIGSPLRSYVFDLLNQRLQNRVTAGRQQGYVLQQDWKLVIRNEDPTKDLTGYLQFATGHSSGDNPALAEFARDRKDSTKISRQQVLVAEQALGARVTRGAELSKTQRFIERRGIQQVNRVDDLFALMNGGEYKPIQPILTRSYSPAEQVHLEVARVSMEGFRQRIDTSVWDNPKGQEQADFDEARERVVTRMGLSPDNRDMVDGWIRQWLGAPKDANPTSEGGKGNVSFQASMDALHEIELNVQDGLYPTWGAEIPIMHYYDVALLWEARNNSVWQLKTGNDDTRATEWLDYVQVALGMNDTKFDGAWLTSVDGFMHSFREAGDGLGAIPLSVSEQQQLKLLDPMTNLTVVSMDPDRAAYLGTETVADTANATFEDIFGGRIEAGRYLGNYPPSSAIAQRRGRMKRWHDENSTGKSTAATLGDIKAKGQRFTHQGTTTNALMRIITNLRAANGMLNPFLYAVAPLEMGVRGILEDTANFLSGEGTGLLSRITAGATKGGSTRYDVDLLQQAKRTYDALGENTKFKAMIYRDLVTLPKLSNAGRVEKWTADMARIAGRWQDPSYGMRASSTARRYIEAAIRNVVDQGSATTLTPRTLITKIGENPEWLERNYPEIHQYAINAVANVRSLKPTVPSLLFRGLVDPLTSNAKMVVNVPSTLMIKIPFLFLPYAFNVATNMLGLQGVNAVAALALQGRQGGKKFGKMQAFLQGTEYNADEHGIDFLNETLEAVDLSGAFIRAGLTHTALMGLGLVAGELGLSGEDDEDKRKRRETQLQGAGYVYDPRDIVNDFRNSDAIFLDNLPDWIPFVGLLKEQFEVAGPDSVSGATSMAQLHWTLKQFISPIMGIEKYLDTGNFQHVVWGFEDALGSMPLVNTNGWDDSAKLAIELNNAAEAAEASGTPESMAVSYGLVLNAVGSLERMLFENSFVNSVYVASDRYDRAPWTIVDTTETGQIIRDDLSVPMATDDLQQYLTDDGTVAEGKPQRDWFNTELRQLGENRATLALFGSLFTGFNTQNSLWRFDMAAKEIKIEKNELSQADATALVLSLWDPDQDQEVLTGAGGEAVIRGLRGGTLRADDPALQNIFLSFEQRQQIQTTLMSEIMQEGLNLGLSAEDAEDRLNEVWYGSTTNPFATPLKDVVWSTGDFADSISYVNTLRYRQLNTTFVMGPDGRPWATGIGRDKLNNFWGQSPLQRYNQGEAGNLGVDTRLNSTDETAQLNTGRRNLERIQTDPTPTPEDILKAMETGFKDVVRAIKAPDWSDQNRYYGNSGGYGGYGSSRGGGYGGGGGGYAFRLNGPERNDVTYARTVPYTNADNPIIRRTTIRRERFSSSRGRLNQWQ